MESTFDTRGEISLRPVQDCDEAFLLKVFASTREAERDAVRWEVAEWKMFIQLQSRGQHAQYAIRFPTAAYDIILCNSEPVGRIWVHHASDEILLLDIAILPEYRSRGIGTYLIKGLQESARAACVPLRHSVELTNPRARMLYERLGFVAIATSGLHTLMQWMPSDDAREAKK